MSQKEAHDQGLFSDGQQASFRPIQVYSNYIEAHIALGRLQEEGVSCWLKDENTVTINPIWTSAVGGIKLMVAQVQVARAIEILDSVARVQQEANACPQCGSLNVMLVSTPRKAVNWFSSLLGFFLGDLAVGAHKVNHCFHCGAEFNPSSFSTP